MFELGSQEYRYYSGADNETQVLFARSGQEQPYTNDTAGGDDVTPVLYRLEGVNSKIVFNAVAEKHIVPFLPPTGGGV